MASKNETFLFWYMSPRFKIVSHYWDRIPHFLKKMSKSMHLYIRGLQKKEFSMVFFRSLTVHSSYCTWEKKKHYFTPQSTRRVAIVTFWRTFQHDWKISPAWWGWGVHGHPFSLSLPLRTKWWCTLPPSLLYPYVYSVVRTRVAVPSQKVIVPPEMLNMS
jgi:hypothetical protein